MPLIVHAAWLRSSVLAPDGALFFWAESQEVAEAAGRGADPPERANGNGRAGGRSRSTKVPSHPYQTPVSQLRTLLTQQIPALAELVLQPASAEVWVPSADGAPVVRRLALGGPAAGEGAVLELAPWQVSGFSLAPLDALACLTQLNNGGEKSAATATIYHQLRLGKDLLYWSHVAKFTLELLIGQDYLPGLQSHPDGYFNAAWQPYVTDPRLQQRLDTLVQMMPPVCRAYNLPSPGEAPSAAAVVEHFVAAAVDAAIRSWATEAAPQQPAQPVQQWLYQLLNGRRRVNLPPQQAFNFYQQWQAWTEQLQFTTDTSFRICFELREPEPDDNRGAPVWTLHYGLQARENPELRIPAREVWQANGGSVRVGSRRLDQPQERLMSGLTAASRIFEPVARSLRTLRPEYTRLTTDEAYHFLREIGPVLESSGFGVVFPDWWSGEKRLGLGLRLRLSTQDEDDRTEPTSPAAWGRGMGGSVRYEWELTLGKERLGRSEFEQMAAMKTPLLRLKDRWIDLDPLQVAAAQRFIVDKQPTGVMSLLQALRVVQASQQEEGDRPQPEPLTTANLAFALPGSLPAVLPVDAVDVDGWLGSVITQLQEQQPTPIEREPEGFVGTLRPYQKRGVGWLAYLRRLGLGACLADDMGLGKTIQAIALLLHQATEDRKAVRKGAKHLHQPALLICPTSVVANWRREVERFAPAMRVMVHHGGNRLGDAAFMEAVAKHDLILTSYGTARRDIDLLGQWRWSNLILDEAQNIKNPTAKQTQAVRSLSAANRIALTGTPVENRLSELWSIVEFLNPGYLETHERFRQRYILPIERYNDDERAAELRRLVQPFLLRRVKSDPTIISDLPEKNEMVVYCSLTQEQAALYEQAVHETLSLLDNSEGIQRRGLVLGLLTKLKQITNHPAHYLKQPGPLPERSGKLERLTEMLEEALAVGDHALVFTQFVEMGTLLQRHLRETFGVEVLFLHGGTPALQRDQMVQAFQEEDGPPIFILSLRAGGAGLNLTRASHVFHFDRWWNPAVENQATDRAFRIGQRRNVQVHKFVVAGTLEERIHAIVEGKQNLADSIVGSGEQWLTELSTEQLRDLLMLRREMLDEL